MSATAIPQSMDRLPAPSSRALKALVVASAYLVGAEIAFLIGTLSDKIFAPFWPPNIVLLCALILTPSRDWWIYILAAFPAHIIAEIGVGMHAAELLLAFATNCMVATVNAFAMRRLLHGPPWFGNLRNALLYVLITAFASPAAVAIAGAFVPILGGGAPGDYWSFWLQWYLSNALSSLALGPLALTALYRESSWLGFSKRQKIEGLVLAITLVCVCVLALRLSTDRIYDDIGPALALLPLTIIIWSAIRFGATGASAAILIAAAAVMQQAFNASSPLIVASSEAAAIGLQVFFIALAVPVLLLGATTEEMRNAVRTARTHQELMALSAVAADSCLWQYDRKAERFWMTENGRSMFGLGADDPLTRTSIEQSIHAEDRHVAIKAMRSASLVDSLTDMEFRIVRPDGEVRWIRARGRARKSARGDREILRGTFTDITERKASEHEAALRQAEIAHLMRLSMLGELSGGIAHELAQPLTAILSNAQAARILMDNDPPDMKEIADALDDIINDDNRAADVLHRMRTLLKRGEIKFDTVDLNDVVRSTLDLLHSELINRRVALTCEFDGTLPFICGDRIQLQQVLINLVMNAVDSMNDQVPSRRMITIRTRSLSDSEIEINVTDQGAGLSPALEKNIFQPFVTTKEHGLGLGLSICSSIIKTHGGRLHLINNSTGGATATFALPRHS